MGRVIALLIVAALAVAAPRAGGGFEPGGRVLLDAHNCYPSDGRWPDRIDRAIATGIPVAIEQDLVWFRDPATGRGRSLVAHGKKDLPNLGLTGREPDLRTHFFERIRPLVEQAARSGDRAAWPIVTLNLDFKTEEPEHLEAVWALLLEYRSWLTTAPRGARIDEVQPMTVGPVLVLTGESEAQRVFFHDRVPPGDALLVFGAATPVVRDDKDARTGAGGRGPRGTAPADITPGRKTNYHRWWNNAWSVVEVGGQREAGDWSQEDASRLRHLVNLAHGAGLWIRFYTLNGHALADTSNGWSHSYNFGSPEAARERWRAAADARVDFIASDQYEALSAELRRAEAGSRMPRR